MISSVIEQNPKTIEPTLKDEPSLSLRGFYSRRHAVRSYPWTMTVSEPAGAVIAFVAYKVGITPNALTTMSGLVSTLGVFAFVLVPRAGVSAVLAFLLLQFGYMLDCSDGQLARATLRCSPFGGWLDIAIDLLSNITIPVALAVVAVRSEAMPAATIFGCIVLIYGQTLFLHSSTTKRKQDVTMQMKVPKAVVLLRFIADHGTFLCVICIARVLTTAIPWTMFGYGLLYSAIAFRIARRLR
jgi:phosphatidylglycerophosphate synthase